MNTKDLSGMSYKELQALAVSCRVPGNMKKDLLVRVLHAVQLGNDREVDRILSELQQTRKRMRKMKRDLKKNACSTPISSPISEDCYYPQHQLPYQWVGAEEEIASRDEETVRGLNYEEFQQFLFHRMQRDYAPYNNDAVPQTQSIVDLRMGAGTSVLRSVSLDLNAQKSKILTKPTMPYNQASPSQPDLQTLRDVASNNSQHPMLLKKMLEAPAGANLGEIAGPEAPYRNWSLEQFPNRNNNQLEMGDSDTLTADSDIDNEDWDDQLKNNNVNRNYFTHTYNKNPLNNIHPDTGKKIIQEIGQLPNNFSTENNNQWQIVYPSSDVQENCQKWIASNTFINKDTNYIEQNVENSRNFHSIYYENTGGNSTTSKPINSERKITFNQQNENINYEANHAVLQGQIPNNSQHYFSSSNGATGAMVNSVDGYYNEQMGNSGQGSHMMHNACSSEIQQGSGLQFNESGYNGKDSGISFQNFQGNTMSYGNGYYSQYSNEDIQILPDLSSEGPSQHQQFYHQQQQHQQQETRKNVGGMETGQPIVQGALSTFCPRAPLNSTVTSKGQLEAILNLRNANYIDYAKIDETSCVYCYAAPIVTHRTDTSSMWCTQKKRFVADGRQHVFSLNRGVYSDTSTGMRMANIKEPLRPASPQLEVLTANDLSSSSMDLESELEGPRPSTDSSDYSMNDVWIHDYTTCPVNSDTEPQSVNLIIDETSDDLFVL